MSREAVLCSEDGWEKDCGRVATTRGWVAFVRWAKALPDDLPDDGIAFFK